MTSTYPCFRASGSHRELGIAHGQQAREFIRGYLDYLGGLLKLTREELRTRALRFQPLFERDCPHLLNEVEGLAEGADIPLADALACQLRGELGQFPEGGCTSFVIGRQGTANGKVLIGQNSDNPPELMDYAYVLKLEPVDKPAVLFWTFGGMIGYHGLNSAGVSHFANSLGGGPGWRFALAHYPMKRLIHEQSSLDGVLELMNRVPVCSNGNYVLCDGGGEILDVELTADGPRPIHAGEKNFLAHANHYLCGDFACEENFQHSLPDSFFRQKRMDGLIQEKYGQIGLEDMKTFLSDEENAPVGILRHPHDGDAHGMLDGRGLTVASLIAEPELGKLHVRRGDDANSPFETYSLDE